MADLPARSDLDDPHNAGAELSHPAAAVAGVLDLPDESANHSFGRGVHYHDDCDDVDRRAVKPAPGRRHRRGDLVSCSADCPGDSTGEGHAVAAMGDSDAPCGRAECASCCGGVDVAQCGLCTHAHCCVGAV